MRDPCLRCQFRTIANEAKSSGDEVYANLEYVGAHIFVIPKGERPDVRIHPDRSLFWSNQWVVWLCEIPEDCACGDDVPLLHELTWQPERERELMEDVPLTELLQMDPSEFLSLL